MKKIPTLFVRDVDRRHVTLEYAVELPPGSVATIKYDGTCVMYDGTDWWFRRELKAGSAEPEGWVFMNYDEATGKTIGWEPAQNSGFYKYLLEAIARDGEPDPGTYELLGPKINANPTGAKSHWLYSHGSRELSGWERDFTPCELQSWVAQLGDEGVVWWCGAEPVAKLKRKDINPRGAEGREE